MYIKSLIPSRQLSYGTICNFIHAIPFEINLRQEKWLGISIYHLPSQAVDFLNILYQKLLFILLLSMIITLLLGILTWNQIIACLRVFLDSNKLTNLIKTNTSFKGKGSSIDLIFTNRKYSFKYTSSYETGLSDHHHMIYTVLKPSYINVLPKLLNDRDYKKFNFGNFKEDLSEALLICTSSYDEFESAFITDKHAPKAKKWLRGNNKPHITKPLLRQAIKAVQA